jgi:hypothetical protein
MAAAAAAANGSNSAAARKAAADGRASFRAPPLPPAAPAGAGSEPTAAVAAGASTAAAVGASGGARLGTALGAGGLSPQLASALQRASSRSNSSAAGAAREPAAPVLVAGVVLHVQATRAGKDNAEAGLPPGWAAHWSNSRAAWHWKGPGGEVAWEKPLKERTAHAATAEEGKNAEASEALPDGWAAVWSRSRSTWYWRHGASGETTWTKPLS